VPVVNAALLFDAHGVESQRWVTIKAGDRLVALAVDSVLGIRSIGASSTKELPPLLRDADGEIVFAIGTLDAELLLFLSAARIVPQALRESLVPDEATL